MIGRLPTETSALVMVFGILEGERLKWQKVMTRAEDIAWIEEATSALEKEPVKLEFRLHSIKNPGQTLNGKETPGSLSSPSPPRAS